jgi:hypothetical protein
MLSTQKIVGFFSRIEWGWLGPAHGAWIGLFVTGGSMADDVVLRGVSTVRLFGALWKCRPNIRK